MVIGNIAGCRDTIQKNVDLSFAYRKSIITAADTTICLGDSVLLRLEQPGDYCWKSLPALINQSNVAYAKPTSRTTYIVVQDTEFGFYYDSITIDVTKAVIVASNDTSICKNEAVQLNAAGGTTYLWSPVTGLSDPTIANPIANPAVTTRYSVRSLVNGSCMAKDSVLITINPLPVVLTNNATSTCPGFPAQITASGGEKYQWSPSQTLSDATLRNPLASPSINTTYTVVVTDINGCSSDGEVKVSIAPTGKIYIPNAFTPNADGINDCFSIKGALGSPFFELSIYNRFGERVFFTDKPSTCWDGRYKGSPQPSGSFAYTLKMSGPCGNFTEKGTVSIIR
jgi:gliding motility-associated-like protein